MIQDYIRLALRNLQKRKLRSWLTMLGIILSIATIFILISASLGLQGAVKEQFRILGTDKFFIHPRGQIAGPGTASASALTIKDIQVIEKSPGVKDISYVILKNAEVNVNNEKRFLLVLGLPGDHAKVYSELGAYKPDEGRLITFKTNGEIMLGSQFKYNNIFSRPVKAGEKMIINGQEFKVRAILQPIGNPSDDRLVYMNLDDFQKIFPNSTSIDQIMVQTNPDADINQVIATVDKRLRSSRDVTEKTKDFTILSPEELLASFGTILNIITVFLGSIAGISLLVGGIGIANTMYTSVIERTREIGTMKAVGAKNSDILLIFLIESGLLGITGGIIGVLLGIVVAKSLEYIAIHQLGTNLLRAANPAYLVLGCLAFAFLAGAISGIWPAWRASKLKAVDALRYE